MFDYRYSLLLADFLPHGFCMRWQPDVIWLHVLSDSAIALAYFCISAMLYYFIRHRPHASFHWVLLAFSLFIVFCGLTHVMDVVTLWYPLYRLEGWLKAATAIVSLGTAVGVARLMPQLLKLPSVSQLESANARLLAEIKQREAAETELSKANLVLQTALNSSQTAAWTWDITQDTAVWSGPVAKVFGLPPEKLNGLGDVNALVHPADRAILRERLESAIARCSDFDLEYRIIRPGGEERWIAGRGDVTRKEDGRVVEMSGVNYDITERRRMEDALARSESQFRQLANAMPQIVFAATPDGRIYFLNDRWYEVTGQPLETVSTLDQRKQVLHPDDRERWEACWLNAVKTGSYEIEYRFWDQAKQEYRWYLSRGRAVRDAGGAIQRWFGTSTDIHDQKTANVKLEEEVKKRTAALSASLQRLTQSEEFLRRSLAEKDTLLREVHHRVRNNLQILCSLLGMQISLIDNQAALAQLKENERRVISMALIHDQLYMHEEMSSIEFDEFVRKLVPTLIASFSQKVAVTCRLELTRTLLSIDEAIPCGLILNELLSNAMEFAYPPGHVGGEIAIELSTKGKWVNLCIKDDGVGLPGDFQLSTTKTLGFSVIKALTAQLRGELAVSTGHGSTFRLQFEQEAVAATAT